MSNQRPSSISEFLIKMVFVAQYMKINNEDGKSLNKIIDYNGKIVKKN